MLERWMRVLVKNANKAYHEVRKSRARRKRAAERLTRYRALLRAAEEVKRERRYHVPQPEAETHSHLAQVPLKIEAHATAGEPISRQSKHVATQRGVAQPRRTQTIG